MYTHAGRLSQIRNRVLNKKQMGQVAGSSNLNYIPNTSDSAVLSRSGVDMDNPDQPDVCTDKQPAPNGLYLNANQTARIQDPESSCSFVRSRHRRGKKGKNQGKWIA